MRTVVPIIVLAICLAAVAGAAPKPAPAPRPVQAIFSQGGLEGLHEVFLDSNLIGEAGFMKAVKMDNSAFHSFVAARLKKIHGLKFSNSRVRDNQMIPQLSVVVVGGTVPHYKESDPPAGASMTIKVSQPVFLTRPGPGGRPLENYGTTYYQNNFSSYPSSQMQGEVKDRVGYLLDEFVKDYEKANPKR